MKFEINLLSKLCEKEQNVLALLLQQQQQQYPVCLDPGIAYPVEYEGTTLKVYLSNSLVSRTCSSLKHPIWFDIVPLKALGKGSYGCVGPIPRTFSFEMIAGTPKLVSKDQAKHGGIAMKQIPLTGNEAKDAFILASAPIESMLNMKTHVPDKKHPYTVSRIGLMLYMAMPLLPGKNMLTRVINQSNYFKKHANDPIAETTGLGYSSIVSWFLQLMDAVNSLHTKWGYMHNDINLRNIMIDDDQNLFLCDFGLATSLADGANNTRCFGTPGYAAPEMVAKKAITAKSDAYGCGKTMYEIWDILDLLEVDDKLYQYHHSLTMLQKSADFLKDHPMLFYLLRPGNFKTQVEQLVIALFFQLNQADPAIRLSFCDAIMMLHEITNLYLDHYENNLTKLRDTLIELTPNELEKPYLLRLISAVEIAITEWAEHLTTDPSPKDLLADLDIHLYNIILELGKAHPKNHEHTFFKSQKENVTGNKQAPEETPITPPKDEIREHAIRELVPNTF